MMSRPLLARATLVVALPLLAASCGGGGSDAGSLTPFNVVPSAITLTGPDANTCGSGSAGRVFVFGGSSPYTVNNTGKGFVTVTHPDKPNPPPDPIKLDRPGDYFEVTVPIPNSCMDNIPIVVVDKLGRQVTFSISSVKGAT